MWLRSPIESCDVKHGNSLRVRVSRVFSLSLSLLVTENISIWNTRMVAFHWFTGLCYYVVKWSENLTLNCSSRLNNYRPIFERLSPQNHPFLDFTTKPNGLSSSWTPNSHTIFRVISPPKVLYMLKQHKERIRDRDSDQPYREWTTWQFVIEKNCQ